MQGITLQTTEKETLTPTKHKTPYLQSILPVRWAGAVMVQNFWVFSLTWGPCQELETWCFCESVNTGKWVSFTNWIVLGTVFVLIVCLVKSCNFIQFGCHLLETSSFLKRKFRRNGSVWDLGQGLGRHGEREKRFYSLLSSSATQCKVSLPITGLCWHEYEGILNFIISVIIFSRQSFVLSRRTSNSLCGWGLPTVPHCTASASQMLGLQPFSAAFHITFGEVKARACCEQRSDSTSWETASVHYVCICVLFS